MAATESDCHFFFLILCNLALNFEGVTQIFQLIYVGTLLAARRVGRVKHQAEATLKVLKYHTMSAIDKQRLFLLSPRACHLTCIRLGNTHRIRSIIEARPEHKQFACLGAIEEATIGHITLLALKGCVTAR